MTVAAECTEKELKILKDEVRALHVSSTLDSLLVKTYSTHEKTNLQRRENELWFYACNLGIQM